jgi:hypothetical protein
MLSSQSISRTQGGALLLALVAAACSSGSGHSGSGAGAPTVQSTIPLDGAVGVPVNASVSATFSEPMDASTLTTSTFTLTRGPTNIPVAGTVIYANSRAVFWPAAHLEDNQDFTANLTTGVHDLTGHAMSAGFSWNFTTGNTTQAGSAVDLGRAANFAILAKSGISTVPASTITGDLGLSPAAATFITGFGLTLDPRTSSRPPRR